TWVGRSATAGFDRRPGVDSATGGATNGQSRPSDGRPVRKDPAMDIVTDLLELLISSAIIAVPVLLLHRFLVDTGPTVLGILGSLHRPKREPRPTSDEAEPPRWRVERIRPG